ncbi:E3 ubiquitin-protein ligase RNF34-like isoform X2 [Astyanax mexicanus]|uniref:E3 ubiquitin-protein ligase RNF34-like isoform X2 n=1 Tax=Astyanax mexicanus TaxID=7994 RepID=A0A8T2KXM9_ASTMX|nr:E3 ubiquitin-protein ligase RNF34-like isoform X2 [Astyanax mexicanus]
MPLPLSQAGASSMWASCCGLLNEVIGTGSVRGQQPGFGGAAGPFRFAPSAGYSTYPPTPSPTAANAAAGLVCKACGLAFSVFRRKKSFCSLCSVLQENLRRCVTCHLLWGTAFQRRRLMRLRVKDLRQYLRLRNISTDTCREKEDLVELVLRHLGAELQLPEDQEDQEEEEEEEEEEEVASDSLHLAPPTDLSSPPAARSTSQQSVSALSVSASQGETPSPSNSSGTSQYVCVFVHACVQSSPVVQRRARASLSDLAREEDIEVLTVRQLKEILARNFVNFSGCCEKWELVERVHRLYRESQINRISPVAVAPLGAVDENLCRICMDAVIDCVLLECGHMVTCTKCGKRMNECPICRQYVVRAVHVFKS